MIICVHVRETTKRNETGYNTMDNTRIKAFFADALEYAEELSRQHNGEYQWILSKRKTSYGFCNYQKKHLALCVPLLMANPEQTVDTIRHELAHELAGPMAGHSYVWKNKARLLNAVPKACHSGQTLFHKYEIYCKECGFVYEKKHRPTQRRILWEIARGYRKYRHKCCHNFIVGERQAKQPDIQQLNDQMPEFSSLL